MYHSEVIHPGNGSNHLQVTCSGSRLALSVNGEFLAEAYDSSFVDGDIGLIVGSFDIPGVDIWFDNLMVMVP